MANPFFIHIVTFFCLKSMVNVNFGMILTDLGRLVLLVALLTKQFYISEYLDGNDI